MVLQVAIVLKDDQVDRIIHDLMEGGIGGSTIVECRGAVSEMADPEYRDHQPMFAAIRTIMNKAPKHSKMVLTILDDEKIEKAKNIVKGVMGDLTKPNTGIIFAVPLTYCEGLVAK